MLPRPYRAGSGPEDLAGRCEALVCDDIRESGGVRDPARPDRAGGRRL